MRYYRYIVILLLCFGALRAGAEITMSGLSDDERLSARYTIGAIRMDDGQLRFLAPDGTVLASMPMEQVRRIIFTRDVPTAVESVGSDSAGRIYPSPATDHILIEGHDAQSVYRVFDLSGHCLLTGQGSMVSVRSLPPGTYILQVDFQLFKFIKH